MSNFFTDTTGHYVDHARLYPEWRHSNEDKEKSWLNKYDELQVLVSNTEKAYRDLLLTAKSELPQESTMVTYKLTNKPQTEAELCEGPLSYKNGILYHNGSQIDDLPIQVITLGKLFLSYPDKFISYETVMQELTNGDYISKKSMQKVVSKLRKGWQEGTHKDLIKNHTGKGYTFEAKKLL